MNSHDVRIWAIRKRPTKSPSYDVRWKVGDRLPFSKTFRTKALADNFRAKLLRSTQKGEEFDTETGLPASMTETRATLTWYDFAQKYLAMKWPHAAPNTRDGINEALTLVTMALLDECPGRPEDGLLREALRKWAFVLPTPGEREVPVAVGNALHWLGKASKPLADLGKPAVLLGVLDALKLKLDGTAAAPETVRRKKNTFVNALEYAKNLGEFTENPMTLVQWKRPRVVKQVDPRVVFNPRQAGRLLDATTYVGGFRRARGRRLTGMFAGMYYGGFRPAEAVGLSLPDCTLPSSGWGSVLLHRTRPTVGKLWTGTGNVHDDRGLKNRPAKDTREVPIPPQLVAIFRDHVDTFGTADDGRLFFNERGGLVSSSTYSRVWEEARQLALPPAEQSSLLADCPYAARHSALSTWLNSGTDPTEVAMRAGNSVEVLLTRYAKCIAGRFEIANARIEGLLREYE
ncbi:tyrosine-type recombinase/integrase [Streptomyces syringium]|uniref:tyrosine-type recombinase/integrase n=1 Tax=Streptomyces syringium TaxID=76729 RepID=UPI00368A71AC